MKSPIKHIWEPIPTEAVTLRYLETGNSQQSLAYVFKIGCQEAIVKLKKRVKKRLSLSTNEWKKLLMIFRILGHCPSVLLTLVNTETIMKRPKQQIALWLKGLWKMEWKFLAEGNKGHKSIFCR